MGLLHYSIVLTGIEMGGTKRKIHLQGITSRFELDVNSFF